MIEPLRYVDPAWFDQEQRDVFGRHWIFAGLRSELGGQARRALDVGGRSLIVQLDGQGRPRAFLNVCSHRHAQLCAPGLHTGALRCPYHGWVYSREGVPVGIPSKEAFPQVVADPQAFALQAFACEAVGEFVFVRLAEHGPSLRSYLGNQHDFLARASDAMGAVTDEFVADVGANWKTVIENALEGYHVPAVHAQTFLQVDGMDRTEQAPVFFTDDPLHSHLEHAANADWVRRFARIERQVGRWPWRFEHYTHRLIFPNLTVTSFMGYSFHVQLFEPVAPERTRVHSRTLGTRFEGATAAGTKMIAKIYEDGHAFTRRVFDEDGQICAKVQAGLRHASRPALLGLGIEDRVRHFQQAYARALPPA